jgi:hypothetical protein
MATGSTAGRGFPFNVDRGALAAFALALSAQLRVAGPGGLFSEPDAGEVLMKTAMAILLSAGLALGQHSVGLSWTASTDAAGNPTLTYALYRQAHATPCPAAGTGYSVVTSLITSTATSYTDTTVSAGAYCYYLEAVLNGASSVPSNTVAATVPVAPPSGLTIVSTAVKVAANHVSLSGTYIDPQYATNWEFYDSTGRTLAKGTVPLETVDITETWKGKDSAAAYYFKVCDSQQCLTQQATASG